MSASSGKVEGGPGSYQPGDWTNEQCMLFMCIALRHVQYRGDTSPNCNDIRLGARMALTGTLAPPAPSDKDQTIATQAARIAGLEADAIKSRQRLEWFAKAMSEDHEYVPYFDTDANCWGYPYLVGNAGGFGGGVGFAGFDSLEQAIDSAMERAALEGSKPE